MYNFFATDEPKRPSTTERKKETLDVNLTPMLDVVMILLIFFIVTSSFVREVAIEFDLTQTGGSSSGQPSGNIVFTVGPQNQVWLRGRRLDIEGLRANIERMHAENPEAEIIIRAHAKSTIQTVARIVDASRMAGVYTVSVESVN